MVHVWQDPSITIEEKEEKREKYGGEEREEQGNGKGDEKVWESEGKKDIVRWQEGVVREIEKTTPSSAAAEGASDEVRPAAGMHSGRGSAGIEREEAMGRWVFYYARPQEAQRTTDWGLSAGWSLEGCRKSTTLVELRSARWKEAGQQGGR
jgi:hypothetical protein